MDADADADADSDTDRDSVDEDGDGVPAAEDCDDGDPSVHPGAEEVCDNGIDDDCDGGPGRCTFHGEIALTGAVHLDGAPGDNVGYEIEAGRDVNGDGAWDLLITSPYARVQGGDVYLATLPAAGGALPEVAALHLRGTSYDLLGLGVALAGDPDTDGVQDILVGAPGRNGVGAAWLIPGTATGEVAPGEVASMGWFGQGAGDGAGQSVAGLGDATGDGIDDIAIGASGYDIGGMVAVLAGPVAGGSLPDADAVLYGAMYQRLGEKIVGGMDLDGDGVGDIGASVRGNAGNSGLALFRGPLTTSRVLVDADALWREEHQDDEPYQSLEVAGDIDGDGLDELAVGTPRWEPEGGDQQGITYLLRGVPDGERSLLLADARIYGETPRQAVGMGVGAAGDVDGDGFGDLMIGAPGDKTRGSAAGLAFLLYGPVSGNHPISDADATFIPTEDRASLGRGLAGAGDADGDGLLDLWLGAEGASTNGDQSGAVYLVPGFGL